MDTLRIVRVDTESFYGDDFESETRFIRIRGYRCGHNTILKSDPGYVWLSEHCDLAHVQSVHVLSLL
jgi:hypothetical protein